MTNAETGEVTEGFTTDLTTLTIDGPISLTPVFEGADPVVVDGPPRTGDVPFDGTLWIIALAALVACAILIGLAVLRRREEEAYEAATATYGAHSAELERCQGHARAVHERLRCAFRPQRRFARVAQGARGATGLRDARGVSRAGRRKRHRGARGCRERRHI